MMSEALFPLMRERRGVSLVGTILTEITNTDDEQRRGMVFR